VIVRYEIAGNWPSPSKIVSGSHIISAETEDLGKGFTEVHIYYVQPVVEKPRSDKYSPDYGLSSQQVKVILCLPLGLSNQQIGDKLQLSEDTIKTHFRHIMKKTKARNRTELAVILARAGYY